MITTADIGEDLVETDAADLETEAATLATNAVEQKLDRFPRVLLGGDDNLTVKEREKRRLDLH